MGHEYIAHSYSVPTSKEPVKSKVVVLMAREEADAAVRMPGLASRLIHMEAVEDNMLESRCYQKRTLDSRHSSDGGSGKPGRPLRRNECGGRGGESAAKKAKIVRTARLV